MSAEDLSGIDMPMPAGDPRLSFKTEISDAISGIVDRDHFMLRLARSIAEVTSHPWVAIYTRGEAGGDLMLRSSTLPSSQRIPARLPLGPDARLADIRRLSASAGISAPVAFVPVGAPTELPAGALAVYSQTGEPLSVLDLALLEDIAGELAPAIVVAEHHHAIKQSAVVDLATRAYTGWYVSQRIEEEIARSQRSHNPVTVVLASVLDFGDVQRAFGFGPADQLLRDLAAELSGLTRAFDVVGVRSRSEFVIMLPETDLAAAATVIDRIHARARRVVERLGLPAGSPPVHVVTGAAAFPADGDHVSSLLLAAEHRLNQNETIRRRGTGGR